MHSLQRMSLKVAQSVTSLRRTRNESKGPLGSLYAW